MSGVVGNLAERTEVLLTGLECRSCRELSHAPVSIALSHYTTLTTVGGQFLINHHVLLATSRQTAIHS